MKRELWLVIFVVTIFMGWMIGYSVPPMLEVGLIGGGQGDPGIKTEVSQELQDYYKELEADD